MTGRPFCTGRVMLRAAACLGSGQLAVRPPAAAMQAGGRGASVRWRPGGAWGVWLGMPYGGYDCDVRELRSRIARARRSHGATDAQGRCRCTGMEPESHRAAGGCPCGGAFISAAPPSSCRGACRMSQRTAGACCAVLRTLCGAGAGEHTGAGGGSAAAAARRMCSRRSLAAPCMCGRFWARCAAVARGRCWRGWFDGAYTGGHRSLLGVCGSAARAAAGVKAKRAVLRGWWSTLVGLQCTAGVAHE